MKSRPFKRPHSAARAKGKTPPPARSVEVEIEEIGARETHISFLYY